MFGTLIIGLPSTYTGGELIIEFEGQEAIADFANSGPGHSLNFAAFYADCDHQVKPLTSGFRVCLVYNLVQKEPGAKVELQSTRAQVDRLAQILAKGNDRQEPLFVLLGHQYTPENFSAASLKLHDRYRAKALLAAAKQAGLYGKLCLVTSHVRGVPAYHSYNHWDDVMEDIIDEDLYIEHWIENEYPHFNSVRFEEQDLISSSPINDGEPLISEADDYFGNTGLELNHWYHYGAVMIWGSKANAQLLEEEDVQSQLEWIGYFNSIDVVTEEEVQAVRNIFRYGLLETYRSSNIQYDHLIDWVINRDETEFFLNLEATRLQFLYLKLDPSSLLRLFQYIETQEISWFFSKVNQDITLPVLEKSMELLTVMVHHEQLTGISQKLISELPEQLEDLIESASVLPGQEGLNRLFDLAASQDLQWAENMVAAFTKSPKRSYIREVLAPGLLYNETKSVLSEKLQEHCIKYLEVLVADKPEVPGDWSRPVPNTVGYEKQWEILRPFLESPTIEVFDYRERKEARSLMEDAIASEQMDVTPRTIRKGSPHTLRLVKNQHSYKRHLQEWKEDLDLLQQLKAASRNYI